MGDEISVDERTIARLERRVLALERALRPFANAAASLGNCGDNVGQGALGFWKDYDNAVTVAHYKRAAELLKGAPS